MAARYGISKQSYLQTLGLPFTQHSRFYKWAKGTHHMSREKAIQLAKDMNELDRLVRAAGWTPDPKAKRSTQSAAFESMVESTGFKPTWHTHRA